MKLGAQNGCCYRQVVGTSGFTVLGFYYVANERKRQCWKWATILSQTLLNGYLMNPLWELFQQPTDSTECVTDLD